MVVLKLNSHSSLRTSKHAVDIKKLKDDANTGISGRLFLRRAPAVVKLHCIFCPPDMTNDATIHTLFSILCGTNAC